MEMPNTNHQMMPSQQLEEVLACPKTQQQQQQQEKKQRPQPDQALKCPRCASTNTKFCYYNNYSLSQPRYFCKGCRRYWTQGGSLRNVPVGGGFRKNKRPNSSPNSCIAKKTTTSALLDHHLMPNNAYPLLPSLIAPPLSYDPSELTLAFAGLHKQTNNNNFVFGHANITEPITPTNNGFLDILRNGFIDNNNNLYNNLSYGVGGNVEVSGNVRGQEGMLSCENGHVSSSSSCKEMDEVETKMVMGYHAWQSSGDGNVAVDPARDYWAGVGAGCSSWQGIMNSSLM